jgi:DNA-binding response OmpR family regulator
MGKDLLSGTRMLAVDDEPDILEVLREELEKFGVHLDQASSYEEGLQKIISFSYDLVILDIMGVRGFDLLAVAKAQDRPVVMLTAHALNPESLKKSIELGARAYVPKDEIDNIAPFLQDVLALSYQAAWKSVLSRLAEFFGTRFGPEWRKTEKEFWEKFERDLELTDSTIIKD